MTSTGCNLLRSLAWGIREAEGIQEGEVREINGGGRLVVGEVRDVSLEVGEVRYRGVEVEGGVSIGEGDVVRGVIVGEEIKGMEVGGVKVRVLEVIEVEGRGVDWQSCAMMASNLVTLPTRSS